MADQQISIPSGLVVVTTYGQVQGQTAECLMNMRSFCEAQGLRNIAWRFLPSALVEKARNEGVRQMLREGHGWLCFVDGDMVFQPDSLVAPSNARPGLLQVAFGTTPHADVVGAWCPLRGELALPTIDSGTGTWESWYPGSGIVEVMRTGGAFLLIKRHVFEGLRDPWFRMRVPARPMDFMAEVDNWARMKMDGQNPFRGLPGEPWEKLEKCARDDPSVAPENFVPVEVGEDSGFCDRARNAGFRIFVSTDVVCGHIDSRVLQWTDHKKAMGEQEKFQRLATGIVA